MTKRSIILLILNLIFYNSFGQESNTSRISIKATTFVSGDEYFIDIVNEEDSVKAIYKFKDSISERFKEDMEFVKLNRLLREIKNYKTPNDTVSILVAKIDSLRQKYTVYSIDSITVSFKEIPSYLNLIQRIFSTSTEILEKEMTKGIRIVIDGIIMEFSIMNNELLRTAYVHSPSKESNPLLYMLIKQTLNLYRDRRSNDFLTKERTGGY